MAYRSHTSLTYGTRTNSSFARPTGATTGDVIVVILSAGDSGDQTAPTVTEHTGFNRITVVGDGNPAVCTYSGDTNYGFAFHAWYKVITDIGSEDSTYTFTHGSADTQGIAYCHSGRNTSTPFSPDATSNVKLKSGGGTDTTAADGLTAPANADLIFAGTCWDGHGTETAPSGFTEDVDGALTYFAHDDDFAGGATGTVSTTNNNSSNNMPSAAFLISLQIAAAAGGLDIPIAMHHYKLMAST